MSRPAVVLSILLFSALYAAENPGLIVVGAGVSGLSAALEAARAGLKVTVVERNSVPGGHAVISSGGLSLIGTPLQAKNNIVDTPELAERDFLSWGEDADPAWVRYYVRNSKTEIHDWMTALGTEFVAVSVNGAGNSVARFHSPSQQGIGLVLPLYREILRHGGVTFLFGHKATALETTAGRVTGVKVENLRTRSGLTLQGNAVLIATGGFAANLDLVRASWSKSMPVPDRLLIGGGFFANGSGMDLVKPAGGASRWLDHQWNYASGLPDPFDPTGERGFFSMALGAIWVNAQAKRFVLEQHEPKATIPVIAAQKPARFWAIFDAEGRKNFRIVHAGFSADRTEEVLNHPATLKSADSIEGLARAVGLPADQLRATVDRYNAMIDAGDDTDFHRFGPNAPRPRGFAPPNRKIAIPPFFAAPNFVLIRKSMGGILVDTACRVLTEAGVPIPGLYASGEATGFGGVNGRNGMEGTFLGPAILMGRVAARTVAAEAKSAPSPGAALRLRTVAPTPDPKSGTSCAICHNIPKLVETKRDGYWHFEHSHKLVLARKLNCLQCHAEMAPFRKETHKIDRHLQTNACQHCHVNPPLPARRPATAGE